MEDDKVATGVLDPTEYDKVVTTKEKEMIDAFLSHIIHVRTQIACTSVRLNVMTQTLHPEDGSLPQGLTIQNTYTEIHNGSRNVTIEVRNSMVYPQTLRKRIPVTRAVGANWVPEPQMHPRTTEAIDKAQGIQTPKLTMKQRQDKLFKK